MDREFTKNHNTKLVYVGDGSHQDIADFNLQSRNQTFEKAAEHYLKNEIGLRIHRNGFSNYTFQKATKKIFLLMVRKGWRFDSDIGAYLYDITKSNMERIKEDWAINRELAYYMKLVGDK